MSLHYSEDDALEWLGEAWLPVEDGLPTQDEAVLDDLFGDGGGRPRRRDEEVVGLVEAALSALPAFIEATPALAAQLGAGSAHGFESSGEAADDTAWSERPPESVPDWSAESPLDPGWEYVEATSAPDSDESEVAFIATAGLLVSAAGLGLGVFDRLESHLLKGAFSVESAPSTYIHNPSPQGLTIQTKVFTFPVTAFHPRYGFSDQTFWFKVTLEYDGFNIRRVSVDPDRGRSSTMVGSDFSIRFAPSAYTAPNEPVSAVAYTISGRWDPIGRGDESFEGAFTVDAAGNLRGLRVSSSQRWVNVGRLSETGGGPVPRPTTASHVADVHFDPAGSHRLSEENIRHIHRYFQGLPPAVQAEIRSGALPIRVLGRASTTGTVQKNQELARRRAEAVAGVLRQLAGSTAHVVVSDHGELGARTGDRTESPDERRVELSVEYSVYRI
jgi:outer membrane protein OmpA-like peptidoglycan-associated protein